MDITATAQAGLSAAFQRFDQSAQRTAWFGRDGSDVDLAGEAVEQIKDKEAVASNIAVLKTGDKMLGQLLDIKA